MKYKVMLDAFEGPFDLLVYLIENARMSIYDIKVSEITRQYIENVETMQKLDVVLAGEFMVLAATLIEIKSKMLLPRLHAEDGKELAEDPRSELVERLLEYKRYKQAAAFLEEQEELSLRKYSKPREDLSIYTKEPDYYLNLDLSKFVKSFNLFLHKQRKMTEVKDRYSGTEQKRMSIETRIQQMRELLLGRKRMKFRDLLLDKPDRYHVVLTFLSMLELARQKRIKLQQNVNFGEITIIADDPDTPSQKGA